MDSGRTCITALVVLVLSAPACVRAEWEAGIGLVDEIDGRQSALATIGWVPGQRGEWELLLGHVRAREPDGGPAVATPTATFLAASRRLRWRGWFVSSGVALADTDGDNPVLSGPFQFLSGLGWQGRHWVVSLRHLSNANTRGDNRGETFLLVARHW